MRKKLILIPMVALLLITVSLLCRVQQTTGPSMELEESSTFVAKEVMAGSVIEHSFKVLNKGDSPLKINVKA